MGSRQFDSSLRTGQRNWEVQQQLAMQRESLLAGVLWNMNAAISGIGQSIQGISGSAQNITGLAELATIFGDLAQVHGALTQLQQQRSWWDYTLDFFVTVATHLGDGIAGVGEGFTEGTNPFFTPTHRPSTITYYIGRLVGNTGAAIVGGLGIIGGAGAAGAGATLTVTSLGTLAPASVPMVAGGASVAVAGIGVAANSGVAISNTWDEMMQFANQNNSGSSGGGGRMTGPEATTAAERLGFRRTNYRSHGQPVFTDGRGRFITPDVDSHIGGVWKMADSPQNLGSRSTRIGTFDANLNWIGR